MNKFVPIIDKTRSTFRVRVFDKGVALSCGVCEQLNLTEADYANVYQQVDRPDYLYIVKDTQACGYPLRRRGKTLYIYSRALSHRILTICDAGVAATFRTREAETDGDKVLIPIITRINYANH